jgi:hypothetical protein
LVHMIEACFQACDLHSITSQCNQRHKITKQLAGEIALGYLLGYFGFDEYWNQINLLPDRNDTAHWLQVFHEHGSSIIHQATSMAQKAIHYLLRSKTPQDYNQKAIDKLKAKQEDDDEEIDNSSDTSSEVRGDNINSETRDDIIEENVSANVSNGTSNKINRRYNTRNSGNQDDNNKTNASRKNVLTCKHTSVDIHDDNDDTSSEYDDTMSNTSSGYDSSNLSVGDNDTLLF